MTRYSSNFLEPNLAHFETYSPTSELKLLEKQILDLKKSNAELEAFAFIASHEIQGPLRIISSYLSLLSKQYSESLDDNAAEYMAFAQDGATRLRSLVENLLAVSRMIQCKNVLREIDWNLLSSEVDATLRSETQETKAEIKWNPLPQIRADAVQLSQVFTNLIGNALKFRSEAAPRVEIGASANLTDWTFSVRDNGIGMAEESYDRIFQWFHRLHSHTEYSGNGIGLALCRKIIHHHGGKIWVRSEVGHGSTFYFTLPKTT